MWNIWKDEIAFILTIYLINSFSGIKIYLMLVI
jgi:hypothetical protein